MDKKLSEFIEKYAKTNGENISEIEKSRLYYLIGKEFIESLERNEEDLLAQLKGRLDGIFSQKGAQKAPVLAPSDLENKEQSLNARLRYDQQKGISYLNETGILFWPSCMENSVLETLEKQKNQTEIWERLTLSGKTFAQNLLSPIEGQNIETLKILKAGFSLFKLCGYGEVRYNRHGGKVILDIVSKRFQSSLGLLFTVGAMQEIFRIAFQKNEFEDLASTPLFSMQERGLHMEFELHEENA